MKFEFHRGRSTISTIVAETCTLIWEHLAPIVMAPPSQQDWQDVASALWERANFPNCLGALDARRLARYNMMQRWLIGGNWLRRSIAIGVVSAAANKSKRKAARQTQQQQCSMQTQRAHRQHRNWPSDDFVTTEPLPQIKLNTESDTAPPRRVNGTRHQTTSTDGINCPISSTNTVQADAEGAERLRSLIVSCTAMLLTQQRLINTVFERLYDIEEWRQEAVGTWL
ncbi:uncharacterized protein [Eleutherodactylus coqui]|uniref:uncharacterized protein n=1 Tax=Eleutherodactylus coqui TaxID=57060 RepID=UPI0034632943